VLNKLHRIQKSDSIYGFAEQALLIQSLPQIVNSCVVIKHQLSLAKVGDFSDKKGMGISPDPLGGGTYNLQSISATPEEGSARTRLFPCT